MLNREHLSQRVEATGRSVKSIRTFKETYHESHDSLLLAILVQEHSSNTLNVKENRQRTLPVKNR